MVLEAIGKKESLADKAYTMIRAAIIRNELVAGEILTEEKFAEILGISRTPIRSALQMLMAENLVKNDTRNRIVVSDVVVRDVMDVDQVRAEIEPISVRLNCQQGLTTEQIATLRSFCIAQRLAAEQGDYEKFFQSGSEFHNNLALFSGNSFLAEMVARASLTAVRFLMKTPKPELYIDNSGSEHERILDLIAQRDTESAVALMRSHVGVDKPNYEQKHDKGKEDG